MLADINPASLATSAWENGQFKVAHLVSLCFIKMASSVRMGRLLKEASCQENTSHLPLH